MRASSNEQTTHLNILTRDLESEVLMQKTLGSYTRSAREALNLPPVPIQWNILGSTPTDSKDAGWQDRASSERLIVLDGHFKQQTHPETSKKQWKEMFHHVPSTVSILEDVPSNMTHKMLEHIWIHCFSPIRHLCQKASFTTCAGRNVYSQYGGVLNSFLLLLQTMKTV